MKNGIILTAGIILVLTVCSEKGKQESQSGNILARVNDEVLTYEDIIYQIPPELRASMTDEDLLDAVETWINTEVLYQKAVAEGIDEEPDVKAMIKWGIKETVAKKLIDMEISSKIEVPSSDIEEIYQAQKDKLKVEKDRFRASHILLDDYETAMAIYNRLEKGSNFEELVNDYSKDRQSAFRGGDIGYFTADQVEAPFAQALVNLKEGSYSKPVKTSYGFHIIKLTERIRAGSDLDSLEAKDRIRNQLLTGKQAEELRRKIDSLKNEADIETFPLPGPDKRVTQDGQ
jgi:parvulin-like peptidyl-prolyl isomerase